VEAPLWLDPLSTVSVVAICALVVTFAIAKSAHLRAHKTSEEISLSIGPSEDDIDKDAS